MSAVVPVCLTVRFIHLPYIYMYIFGLDVMLGVGQYFETHARLLSQFFNFFFFVFYLFCCFVFANEIVDLFFTQPALDAIMPLFTFPCVSFST